MHRPEDAESRVLVYAPIGRDGEAGARLLQRAGFDTFVCRNIEEVLAQADAGALAVCLTEEGLFGKNLELVSEWLKAQPAWSGLPFVVLTGKTQTGPIVRWREKMTELLGNVSLLERPVQSLALTTTVQTAARARTRQYEIRTLLQAEKQAAKALESVVASRTRELELANAELQQQMRERSRIEESLRQAQKLEALGQLTGGVAHDFNNLLMVISGGLQMLQRPIDEARRTRLYGSMRQAVDRGASLSRQLLTFARRQALRPEVLNLNTVVQNMLEMLERSLRGDIVIALALADDLWPVEVDPGELELVILNLAVNARDAMPDGGVIEIRTENMTASGKGELTVDHIALRVSDTGTGMSPAVAERVFEPFFTTKDVGKGSGLGLAQAYGFAKQSGGAIDLSTEMDVGTTVSVLLPRSKRRLAAQGKSGESGVVQERPAALNVLLVEDDADVATLTASMLEELGYVVTPAASAAEALDVLNDGAAIDVMLTDAMMPGGKSGIQLAREVRAQRPDLPVALMTGFLGEEVKRAGQEGIPLLSKPYRLEQLAGLLLRLTGRRAAGRA